jgi:hypothetical protein
MSAETSRGHSNGKGDRPERESDRLRADIDATHRRLEGLLGELDRRRREAFDVKLQMRRHPVAFAVGAALALGALGGGTAFAIARIHRRHRQQHSPSARLLRLWQMSGHSSGRVNDSKSVLGSITARAGQVAVAILLRRLATRFFDRRRKRD